LGGEEFPEETPPRFILSYLHPPPQKIIIRRRRKKNKWPSKKKTK